MNTENFNERLDELKTKLVSIQKDMDSLWEEFCPESIQDAMRADELAPLVDKIKAHAQTLTETISETSIHAAKIEEDLEQGARVTLPLQELMNDLAKFKDFAPEVSDYFKGDWDSSGEYDEMLIPRIVGEVTWFKGAYRLVGPKVDFDYSFAHSIDQSIGEAIMCTEVIREDTEEFLKEASLAYDIG